MSSYKQVYLCQILTPVDKFPLLNGRSCQRGLGGGELLVCGPNIRGAGMLLPSAQLGKTKLRAISKLRSQGNTAALKIGESDKQIPSNDPPEQKLSGPSTG